MDSMVHQDEYDEVVDKHITDYFDCAVHETVSYRHGGIDSLIASIDPGSLDKPVSFPPTAAEWERYRPIIAELYYTRGLKLEEVMSTMKNEYGFIATIKMYSRKRTQWQLFKNLKKREVKALLALRSISDKTGQAAPMTLRGHLVNMDHVQRSARRKRMNAGNLSIVQKPQDKKGLRDAACGSSLGPLQMLSLPAQPRRIEQLFFETDRYFRACLAADHNAAASSMTKCVTNFACYQNIEKMIAIGISYYYSGDTQASWHLWRIAFRHIDDMVNTDEPEYWAALLKWCVKLQETGHPRLAVALLSHFKSVMTGGLKPSDTRLLLINTICSLQIDDLSSLITPYQLMLKKVWQDSSTLDPRVVVTPYQGLKYAMRNCRISLHRIIMNSMFSGDFELYVQTVAEKRFLELEIAKLSEIKTQLRREHAALTRRREVLIHKISCAGRIIQLRKEAGF